ncbi:MAG TPA: OB-fold nucleic acid binding domain-containing protein, partial [Thermoleophilaceae bacterium]|nr:OB-fold nucleic acid binding domain-containing protein [Thermoleophilaceae bacterium]
MEQQTLIAAKLFVRDLVDGQTVDSVFAVRERVRRQKKNGDSFVKLQLGDLSGTVEAVIWDEVDQLYERCPAGQVVRVIGTFSVDQRYGSSLTVRSLRAAE